ncbi:hypothetical protein CJ030_MR7G016749 [Morella rubra]|uniref:Transmembrane protein n=1 Tax=Morella rubra TaxID=262757 RepID=A0A6A1UXF8_9ROSI|nr:hypothetical protein CJ030_MR7G016749 [Morella rubra]
MAFKIKTILLLLLILLIPLSGMVEGFNDRMNPNDGSLNYKDVNRIKLRKLSGVVLLDYDDAGPNPKHDYPRRKPGNGGGRNP